MNRADLQALSRLRIKEARLLLKHRQFEGAYYLTGYAIECALKAAIAKRTAKYDFPDKGAFEKLLCSQSRIPPETIRNGKSI